MESVCLSRLVFGDQQNFGLSTDLTHPSYQLQVKNSQEEKEVEGREPLLQGQW